MPIRATSGGHRPWWTSGATTAAGDSGTRPVSSPSDQRIRTASASGGGIRASTRTWPSRCTRTRYRVCTPGTRGSGSTRRRAMIATGMCSSTRRGPTRYTRSGWPRPGPAPAPAACDAPAGSPDRCRPARMPTTSEFRQTVRARGQRGGWVRGGCVELWRTCTDAASNSE